MDEIFKRFFKRFTNQTTASLPTTTLSDYQTLPAAIVHWGYAKSC
jgi:hypothetical protein